MRELAPSTPAPVFTIFLRAMPRVAARCVAFFQGFGETCRSVPSPLDLERINIVLPGRRALVSLSAAYPCHLQTSCVRVEDHSTTTEFLGVGQSFSELRKASADGCGH
jgi:hypothetical protein